jgi:hypothetical protein
MRKKGYPPEGGGRQNTSTPLRAPHLEDMAERLFDTYIETFKQAPESDFLLKRYFFEMYFEKNYLQDNVFFIPRADFLWFFKYFQIEKPGVGIIERTIELKKRSTERAKTEVEIATIQIRTHYTYEQGAADIIYTRKASESAKEAFILKNTKEAAKHVAQLLVDFHNDKVTSQPY